MGDTTKSGAWANMEESLGELRAIIAPTVLGATAFFLVGIARYAGRVTEVAYYPNDILTGAADNTRRQRLYNRTTGAGVTVIADLQYDLAIDLVAKTKKVIPLHATPANLVVAAGDLIEFNSAFVGTGIADPGGLLVVTIART